MERGPGRDDAADGMRRWEEVAAVEWVRCIAAVKASTSGGLEGSCAISRSVDNICGVSAPLTVGNGSSSALSDGAEVEKMLSASLP